MIAVPLPTNINPDELDDSVCLGAMTEQIAAMVRDRDPEMVRLAQTHGDTDALIEDLRSRPQRDDDGTPDDGPKVDTCEPVQRFRKNPPDPNCVERAATYLAAAELIDPVPVRRLATADTPAGLHTFPVEDGEPVVLDPYQSRNALAAGLFRAAGKRRNGGRLAMTPAEAVDWIAEIASEPSVRFDQGSRRVRNGHLAVRGLLVGRPLCVAEVRDVAFMLALAERESRMWGETGPRIVTSTARAIDKLDKAAGERWQERLAAAAPRNATELRIAGYRIRPDTGVIGALGRVGGRLGFKAGIEALRVKLATLGVTPPVLNSIEEELNREGLSLGALSKPPPMPGSLNALTPEAIAGHWLARKL